MRRAIAAAITVVALNACAGPTARPEVSVSAPSDDASSVAAPDVAQAAPIRDRPAHPAIWTRDPLTAEKRAWRDGCPLGGVAWLPHTPPVGERVLLPDIDGDGSPELPGAESCGWPYTDADIDAARREATYLDARPHDPSGPWSGDIDTMHAGLLSDALRRAVRPTPAAESTTPDPTPRDAQAAPSRRPATPAGPAEPHPTAWCWVERRFDWCDGIASGTRPWTPTDLRVLAEHTRRHAERFRRAPSYGDGYAESWLRAAGAMERVAAEVEAGAGPAWWYHPSTWDDEPETWGDESEEPSPEPSPSAAGTPTPQTAPGASSQPEPAQTTQGSPTATEASPEPAPDSSSGSDGPSDGG